MIAVIATKGGKRMEVRAMHTVHVSSHVSEYGECLNCTARFDAEDLVECVRKHLANYPRHNVHHHVTRTTTTNFMMATRTDRHRQ